MFGFCHSPLDPGFRRDDEKNTESTMPVTYLIKFDVHPDQRRTFSTSSPACSMPCKRADVP